MKFYRGSGRGARAYVEADHHRAELVVDALDLRPRAVSFMVEGPSVASREVSGHFVFPHRWDTVTERVE